MVRHGELLKRRNGTFEMAAKVLVGLPGFEPISSKNHTWVLYSKRNRTSASEVRGSAWEN